MLTELTNKNYNDIISTKRPLLIEFYSPTCVHCKRLEPVLAELADEEGENAVIAKCDVTAEPFLGDKYDITALPTLLFIKDGDVKDRLIGFTHKLIIAEGIKKLK